jgi:mono/diheme cytochrome c family protein
MPPSSWFRFGLALTIAPVMAAQPACGDVQDGIDGSGQTATNGGFESDERAGSNTADALKDEAKLSFTQLAPDLGKVCGGCHGTEGNLQAPQFLKGAPDPEKMYSAIKLSTGFVTADLAASKIIVKTDHAGPSLAKASDSLGGAQGKTLDDRVRKWLALENASLAKTAIPTTDPVAMNPGPIEIDLSKLGVAGVKLKMTASISTGGVLNLRNIRVSVPAVGDRKGARLVAPKFLYMKDSGKTFEDIQDAFSNLDQIAPGGADSVLGSGSASFYDEDWKGFTPSNKLMVRALKLELSDVIAPVATGCKDVSLFQSQLLPTLQGANEGAGINCQGCHTNAARPPILTGAPADICAEVAKYVNKTAPEMSPIIKKPTGGHSNGQFVSNPAMFTSKWTSLIPGSQIFP